MVLGKSRQAHQRTQSFLYAKWYWVNHGRLTSEQSCTRTLDRQRTIMHSNTRQALNGSTRSVYPKWYWVNHGKLTSERQAHQRTRSLPSATHRHSSITRPCCSSAQAPSFLSFSRAHQRTIMHSNTRQALNASTRSVYAKWYWVNHGRLTSERKAYLPLPIVTHQSLDPAARALERKASCLLRVDAFATRCRGNHMHDNSRFQRDIDWRHRRLSLSLSTTTHKSHSRTI